jgi:ATP-dependent Lon protease
LVLPVGGIKEKVIAAQKSGAETLILPKRNKNDILKVPDSVLSKININFIEDVEEVLSILFDIKSEITFRKLREKVS